VFSYPQYGATNEKFGTDQTFLYYGDVMNYDVSTSQMEATPVVFVWEKYVSDRRDYNGRSGTHTFTHAFLRWDTGSNSDAARSIPRDAFYGRFVDDDVFQSSCNSSMLGGAGTGHHSSQSASSLFADPDRCATPDALDCDMGSGHLAFCSATVTMRVVPGDGD
jgi:hypothetical protein